MVVLAADTSTSYNTVALTRDGRLLSESTVDAGRKHSERLLETMEWVLSEAGLTLNEIDLLAISAGPGSFTGLRVGVATWKGLALGRNLPLMAVPTLDAMARLAPRDEGLVCPLLDAKMNEVFGAVYRYTKRQATKISGDLVCSIDEFLEHLDGPALFLGDGALRYRGRIEERVPEAVFASPGTDMPRAWAVAEEAVKRYAEGVPAIAGEVIPVYLRQSQAEAMRAQGAHEAAVP